MKVELTNDKIVLDARDLVDALCSRDKSEIAMLFATNDDVVRNVVEQLCNGSTEDGSSCSDMTLREARQKLINGVKDFAEMRARDIRSVERRAYTDGTLDGEHAIVRELFGNRNWPDYVERALSSVRAKRDKRDDRKTDDTEKLYAIAAKFKETLSFFVVNTELRSNEAVDALGEFERAVDVAVEKLEGFGK